MKTNNKNKELNTRTYLALYLHRLKLTAFLYKTEKFRLRINKRVRS